MAKTERTAVDWKKPIEHVVSGTKIVYCGPQQHVTGEFKHLVLSGEDGSPMMLDDFGCIKTKGTIGVQKIRNVVEKPATVPPRMTSTVFDMGPVAELTAALERIHEEVPSLREVVIRATAALVRTSEENIKAAAAIAGSVQDLRKLAAEQQTAYMNANMMLMEELRKELPKSPAVEVEPPPPPAKPKPVAIVRDLAEIGKAVRGTAEIKNFHHLETRAAKETVQTLAMATGVKRIAVGGYNACRSWKDGHIKYNHEEVNGLKATVYGRSYSHELFVACDKVDMAAVKTVIEYLGKETAAAR